MRMDFRELSPEMENNTWIETFKRMHTKSILRFLKYPASEALIDGALMVLKKRKII